MGELARPRRLHRARRRRRRRRRHRPQGRRRRGGGGAGAVAGAPARAEGLDGLLPPGLRRAKGSGPACAGTTRTSASTGEDGRRSWPPLVELLLHGTQSVVPPTIHPDTGQPYRWLTPDTLEDTPLGDLPELPADPVARLDAELGKLGLTRENPNGRARAAGIRELAPAGAHDLEKPRFRSMNDRALAALDRWFPALGLPKTRQRGAGSWEAVAVWRPSSSGRPLEKRGANLHASPSGIRDFGDGEPYTAIDLVIAARGCSFDGAVEWLEPFLDPEPRAEIDLDAIAAAAERRRAAAESADRAEHSRDPIPQPGAPIDLSRWCAAPAFDGLTRRAAGRPPELPSDAAFEALVPRTPQPFPLGPEDCPGVLGEVAAYIDEASATATEAGALAVALPRARRGHGPRLRHAVEPAHQHPLGGAGRLGLGQDQPGQPGQGAAAPRRRARGHRPGSHRLGLGPPAHADRRAAARVLPRRVRAPAAADRRARRRDPLAPDPDRAHQALLRRRHALHRHRLCRPRARADRLPAPLPVRHGDARAVLARLRVVLARGRLDRALPRVPDRRRAHQGPGPALPASGGDGGEGGGRGDPRPRARQPRAARRS